LIIDEVKYDKYNDLFDQLILSFLHKKYNDLYTIKSNSVEELLLSILEYSEYQELHQPLKNHLASLANRLEENQSEIQSLKQEIKTQNDELVDLKEFVKGYELPDKKNNSTHEQSIENQSEKGIEIPEENKEERNKNGITSQNVILRTTEHDNTKKQSPITQDYTFKEEPSKKKTYGDFRVEFEALKTYEEVVVWAKKNLAEVKASISENSVTRFKNALDTHIKKLAQKTGVDCPFSVFDNHLEDDKIKTGALEEKYLISQP